MLKHFDHLTIVVQDVERAKEFFGVLEFKEAKSVVIAGEPFASYMGVPDIKADHVTPGPGECIAANGNTAPALSTPPPSTRSAHPRCTRLA